MQLRINFLIHTLVLLLFSNLDAKPEIQIVYPKEGEPVYSADSLFVLGNIQPPEAMLYVNSLPAKVYPNGAFLRMVPVPEKPFAVECVAILAEDTSRTHVHFPIPDYLQNSPFDSLVFDESYIFPRVPVLLNAGEIFRVVAKGTPSCKATFDIDGVASDVPMYEIAANRKFFWGNAPVGGSAPGKHRGIRGVYTGTYRIKPSDHAFDRKIRIKLQNANAETLRIETKGRFSADTTAQALLVKRTTDSQEMYSYFSSRGTWHIPVNSKFRISGKYGEYSRVRFTEEEQVWMALDTVSYLPVRTQANTGLIYSATAGKTSNKTTLTVRMSEPLPVKIEQQNEPARLILSFYGIRRNYDKVYNLRSAPQLKSVEWVNLADSIQQLVVDISDKQIWGYKSQFENNHFILEIKNTPEIPQWPLSPLRDKVITLDPGHNPETGAIGPTNLMEKDVNMEVCHRIRKRLEERGAMVVLTRDKGHGITLAARPRLAAFVDSDILISVHFNSLPDGVNPYKNRGTSTYYFQPMSYDLAQEIHKKLLETLKLEDFGLFYRNLLMTRPTEMLSVLIEPAFIIHPEEEILIRSEEFQEKIANALVEALEAFYLSHR